MAVWVCGSLDNPGFKGALTMQLAYDVVPAFRAISGISGSEHRFTLGNVVLLDSGQTEDKVWIEAGGNLFQVEHSVFDNCCKWKNEDAPIL